MEVRVRWAKCPPTQQRLVVSGLTWLNIAGMSGEQMIHHPAKYCNSQRFIRSFSDWRAALSASVAEMLSACSREPHWAQLGYLSGGGVSFKQYSHMPADWHVIVVVCDRLESVLFLTPGQLARRVVLPSSQSRVRVQRLYQHQRLPIVSSGRFVFTV